MSHAHLAPHHERSDSPSDRSSSNNFPSKSFPSHHAARLRRLVQVKQTHVGRGVFARRGMRQGLVIAEIHGAVLDEHPDDSSYVMELAGGRLLDPAPPLRFVNHGCEPNCEIFYWVDDERGCEEERLWLQTIRPIAPGEELLIDYCWPADAAIPCRCGSAFCRGWVVDPEELHLLPRPAVPK
jgi:SET domain-containing protein